MAYGPSPFAEDRGASSPDPPVQWSELTDAQSHLLVHSGEGMPLWDALDWWVVNDDAGDWNVLGLYAGPLIAAARCLLQWQLIEIWREPRGAEPSRLGSAEALVVVSEPRNWLLPTSDTHGSESVEYQPRRTQLTGELGHGAPRAGDSDAVRLAHEHRRIPPQSEIIRRLALS